MSQTESCCPPGSHPYLEAKHADLGKLVSCGGDSGLIEVNLYVARPSGAFTSAVIVLPDVWGWNGGRVRAIADSLAGAGYLAVVPRLLAPGLDGGTDGDALPPGGAFSMDWIKAFPWEVQRPKVAAALAYVKGELSDHTDAGKVGVLGFCYGGHPACHLSAGGDITCGVVAHPSMQLEQFAFGGDFPALTRSVGCPFLMLPAGNDLALFGPETEFAAALKQSAKGAECVIKPYPEMAHGWVPRGDLADPKVKRDVEAAMADVLGWFAKYL